MNWLLSGKSARPIPVPDFIVDNRGDTRVLFIEGEELRGAKQNSILNATVLIATKSKVRIPRQQCRTGPLGVQVTALRVGGYALSIVRRRPSL